MGSGYVCFCPSWEVEDIPPLPLDCTEEGNVYTTGCETVKQQSLLTKWHRKHAKIYISH